MRLRNETITLGLKRKALSPVLYERIDEKNARIGNKWFKYSIEQVGWHMVNLHPIVRQQAGVVIYHGKIRQFQSNSWPDIKTDGTYEEFEESFNLWFNRLGVNTDEL